MSSERTRQVFLAAPERVELRDAEEPDPGPGAVRIRSSRIGVCGSDVHAYRGVHPFIDLPVVPGHEVVGTVDAIGSGVVEVTVGDRVTAEANIVDGTCRYCRAGLYNQCEQLQVLGCQTSGAMADLFTIPASRLHRLPASIGDREAALIEPLSSGTHALRLAGGVDGRAVAILGAGPIGLLCLAAAVASGASAVAVTDLRRANLDRAHRLGAEAAVDAAEDGVVEQVEDALGGRPDVTIDCVAVQSTVNQSIALAERGGTIVVLGVPTGALSVPMPLVQDREIRIQGSAMYVREDFVRAMELVSAGAIPGDEIVTASLPLDRAAEAFAAQAGPDHVKVHLTVEDG
jgi:2-desacetyl-2-hydroxyethyl bacteriochlorophyllide A dehydrogenase